MKYTKYLLTVLPFIGLFLWVYGRFDGLYGQDSFSYYTYATGPLTEAMPGLPPPFFWPPGYPLLVWLASLVVGQTPLAGQLVSLLSGAATAVFTTLLAKDLRFTIDDLRFAPLLAGLLVAFNGQLWQSSVVVMSDTPALAFATLGVWAVVKYGRSHHLPWLLLAAGALAYAILTRWAYALTAIPVTIFALWHLWQAAKEPLARWRFVGHAVTAAGVTLLVLLPLIIPTLAQVAEPQTETAVFAGDLAVYTWNPLNAFRRTFVTTDGTQTYSLPNGLYYAAALAHKAYFTPLLAWLLLPGLWAIWRTAISPHLQSPISNPQSSPKNTPAILLIVAWAAIVYLFHAGAPWQNFRFTLAYLPPTAIITAVGFAAFYHQVPKFWGLNHKGREGRKEEEKIIEAEPLQKPVNFLQWAAVGLGVVGLAAMGIGGWRLTDGFIERKVADLTAVFWVETHTPPDSRIISLNMTATLQQYSQRQIEELYYLTPADLEILLADDIPTYLFVDVASVTNQWRDLSPGQNYQWLRDTYGLREIGQERTFTLFLINP